MASSSQALGPYTKGNLQAAFRRGYYMDDAASAFSRGIIRESARFALPPGAVWDALDFLLDQGGKAYKRGGSTYACTALPGQVGTVAVAAPEFHTDPRVIAIGTDGSATRTLFDITSGTPATGVDVHGAQPVENPPLYQDRLIITDGLGNGMGSFYPPQKAYLDTGVVTVADLGGSPPNARCSCVHLGLLVLANGIVDEVGTSGVSYPNRLWFSPFPVLEPSLHTILDVSSGPAGTFTIGPGDFTAEFIPLGEAPDGNPTVFHVEGSTGNDGYYQVVTSHFDGTNTILGVINVPDATADGSLGVSWDVFEAYFDADAPITGLVSIGGVLIVFTRGLQQRVLGATPPGTTGHDMQLQPAGAPGCVDARSIVQMGGLAFFANEQGMYQTNGTTATSITTKGGSGIGPLWDTALADFAPALGAVVCAGTHLDKWLFVTVRHPDPGPKYQFLYYAPAQSWIRLGEAVTATMYGTRFAPVRELYASYVTADPAQILALSPLFNPTSDNEADADGTAVEPLLELTFGDALSLKAFQYGFVTYLLDADSQADPWTSPYKGTDGSDAGADWPTGGPTTGSFSGLDGDILWQDLGATADIITTWQPNTVYQTGVLVIPTVPNGHTYKNQGVGESGPTEPVWPTDGSVVTDFDADWLDLGPGALEVGQWEPTTAYTERSVVTPPTPNGHAYIVYPDYAGTSGDWPTGTRLVASVASGLNPGSFTEADSFPPGDHRRRLDPLVLDDALQTQAFSVRLAQDGESAVTEVYSIDIDLRPQPSSLEGPNG